MNIIFYHSYFVANELTMIKTGTDVEKNIHRKDLNCVIVKVRYIDKMFNIYNKLRVLTALNAWKMNYTK